MKTEKNPGVCVCWVGERERGAGQGIKIFHRDT